MKILDCTLRDGGYYTNWDFNENISNTYIQSFNELPVDYLEIGYRSPPMDGYYGKFYYCPIFFMKEIREKSNKKISIMLNERDVKPNDATILLEPLKGLVDMVRIAVDPANFSRALRLAEIIRILGFEVGFNVMYMSSWESQKDFLAKISEVDGIVNYFYMVDSYGGVYPEDIKKSFDIVRSRSNVKIGFHGHNNLELAFINTLTAIECGADIVDSTVTGMGRGAGNLKTELLLTALNKKGELDLDFTVLSSVVDVISELQESYRWGTNLPYMVSGANSLSPKDIMNWVSKRYYSYNSIIRALTNKTKGLADNIKLDDFRPQNTTSKVLVVGGGSSGDEHSRVVLQFLNQQPDIVVIHVSSKNTKAYESITNEQIHCLVGNEGHRLESVFEGTVPGKRTAVLPPYPRIMGTYIPSYFQGKAFQLKEVTFSQYLKDSVTALAIQTAFDIGCDELYFVGYDGYNGIITQEELELFNENEALFSELHERKIKFSTLTPSKYKELPKSSIYASI